MGHPQRVLVAVNDATQLEDLVGLGCTLARGEREARVFVLHAIVIPRALPLEAEMREEIEAGERLLARAEEVAEERFEREVETDLLQAREAGPAILEEINEKGITAVVLGYRRRRRFGQRVFGSTMDYVVKHAPCRVVINVSPERGERGRGGEQA